MRGRGEECEPGELVEPPDEVAESPGAAETETGGLENSNLARCFGMFQFRRPLNAVCSEET